jgi:hypothetical protein
MAAEDWAKFRLASNLMPSRQGSTILPMLVLRRPRHIRFDEL